MTPQKEAAMHKDFEAFVKAELGDIAVMDGGRYISQKINNYWKIWKHLSKPSPEPEQPAQRTWVGLTKEEMDELWYRLGYMDLMIAIEAKLKEKNTP